jgi:hypothetical protein
LPRLHSILKAFLSVMSVTWLLVMAPGDGTFHRSTGVLYLFLYTAGISGRRKKRPELFNNCAYNETERDIFSKLEFL